MTNMLFITKRRTTQIATAEAKANLAELIRRAEAGEEIELTRYGRPVARLVGAAPAKKVKFFGLHGRRI